MTISNSSFLAYLGKFQDKMGISGNKKFSLYKYSSEFLKFLKDELKLDTSFASMSITDIIEEGLQNALQNPEDTEKQGKNFLTDMLLNMFKDSDIIKDVDYNQNEQIDKEEIDKYLEVIDFDGDKNITLDEIFSSIDKLKDGTLQPLLNPVSTPEEPPATSGGGGGGGGGSIGGNTDPGKNEDPKPKTIADMSLEELKTEKTSRESSLTEAQNNLDAVYNGTNENVKTAQDDYKTAKDAYNDAVENDGNISAEFKKKRKNNLDNIDVKEKEITETKIAIKTKDSEVLKQEAVIGEDDATIQGLESALASLNSSSADGDEEKAKEIATKKADVEAQLKTAKEKKTNDEAALQKMKEELQALNNKKDAQEGELKTLETERAEIENEIATNEKYSEAVKTALKTFQDAKTNLDSVKSTEETNAKDAVTKAKEAVTEVDKAINEKTKSKIEKDNSLKSSAFADDVQYSTEYITDDSGMQYLVMKPADADPDEELPMLVYLHGLGEVGANASRMKGSAFAQTLLSSKNGGFAEGFRGYIICPVLQKGNWGDRHNSDSSNQSKAERGLRSIVNNFQKTHKVDKNNIALTGHSLGGIGTIYMAKHMQDVFSRAAVLSGYEAGDNNGVIDIGTLEKEIPIMGFAGDHGDGGALKYMNGKFTNLVTVNADHGGVPRAALLYDANNNGRSDLLEFLFPD